MPLSADARRELRRYWTDRLGVPRDAFDGGVSVGVAAERGVQVFVTEGTARRRKAVVAGAPPSLVEPLREATAILAALDWTDRAVVAAWFADRVGARGLLGPTFYGYVDREGFTPPPTRDSVRPLRPDDRTAYDTLRAACPDGEWANGGSAFVPRETVGLFRDGDLLALSGYETWDDRLAHLSVVVHPAHRGEGYGRSVVAAATDRALSAGLLAQYRTLDRWPWSVSLAESLGFERFATATLVAPDPPDSPERERQ